MSEVSIEISDDYKFVYFTSVCGSFFLSVRDVLQPSFYHTSKFITKKSFLLLLGCVGELVFPWQPRKRARKKPY